MPVVLQLLDAHKRYGGQALFDGASCALADDQKVGLIGRNGSGKSTLCRVLLGDEELDKGEVVRGRNLRLGYVRQHDPFKDHETVRDFLMRSADEGGLNYLLCRFAFGDITGDEALHSLDMFTRHVMPDLVAHRKGF